MIEAVQIQVYTGHGECRVSHLDARRRWPAAGIELHARTLVTNVQVAPRRQAFTLLPLPLPPGPIVKRKVIRRSTPDGDSAACRCKHARLVSTWIQVQLRSTCTVRVQLQERPPITAKPSTPSPAISSTPHTQRALHYVKHRSCNVYHLQPDWASAREWDDWHTWSACSADSPPSYIVQPSPVLCALGICSSE